jgi:hypothetical protein
MLNNTVNQSFTVHAQIKPFIQLFRISIRCGRKQVLSVQREISFQIKRSLRDAHPITTIHRIDATDPTFCPDYLHIAHIAAVYLDCWVSDYSEEKEKSVAMPAEAKQIDIVVSL